MLMLTELLRFAIRDDHGRSARLADLAISLLEDDYPPVTHVLFENEGKPYSLDWSKVSGLDRDAELFRVEDLDQVNGFDDPCAVLLKRDILDALVLDLLGRRTTRVCDLRLYHEKDGSLRLKAVDAGLAAMIRRVTRGRFGKTDAESLFDWKYVEFLRGDPAAVDNGAGYRLRINRLPAGEIARLADYIPYLHAAELLKLLPDEKAADVLQAMSLDRQVQVIEELPENEAVDLVCRMSPDLATDLIGRLHLETMLRWLALMSPRCRNRIVELLRYPEESVGGVMINDIVFLPIGMTVAQAKETIQKKLADVDLTAIIYIVDEVESRCLRGSVLLRDLLTADDELPLNDMLDPYLETLDPLASASDAAYHIVSGQLPAMPVIGKDKKLLGAMTAQAAIAQLVPATSNLQNLRIYS